MRITEDPEFKAQLIRKITEREFSERTGIHCSDLCYCLNKQVLRRLRRPEEEHTILLFSLGWATQRWLTGQNTDIPEMEVDGITVTCDALMSPDGGKSYQAPWELKCTFQSSAKPIEENTAWIHQIMAQCYVTNSLVAWLSRLEVMGNWKSVFGKKEEKGLPENEKPTLHAYRLEFTQQELDDNWEWLKARSIEFQKLLGGRKPLPKCIALPQLQGWECQYCPVEYKKLCEEAQ